MFEPSFEKVKSVLTKVFDGIVAAVFKIPRLETQLYLSHRTQKAYLKVSI